MTEMPTGADRRSADEIEADLAERARRDSSWQVAELFCSVNGEGPKAGRLAVFVRFAGCNLKCAYCDTAWANEPGCPTDTKTMSDLVAFVAGSGAECITLTGGEPLLQDNLDTLLFGLLEADPDWAVEIETNGAVDLSAAAQARHAWAHRRSHELIGDDGSVLGRLNHRNVFVRESQRIAFTMDWKLPASGMGDQMLPGNLALLEDHDCLKFVVGAPEDLDSALEVMDAHQLRDRAGIFFSPVHGQMDPAQIVDFMKRNRLARARLQLQLHKAIWPGVEKGV